MHLDPLIPIAVIVAVRVGWRLVRTAMHSRGGGSDPRRVE
jgi:hypothetical protein